MADESGTPSAPPKKAAGKSSGNVTGAQVEQMLLKREAAAKPEPVKSVEHVVQAPEKTEETAKPSAPSLETPQAPQPEAAKEPEKAETPETSTPESDDVLSQLSPELKEKIDKRIGKEVGKRKSLEDEIARLKVLAQATAQDQAVTPAPAVILDPTPDNPLANVVELGDLTKHQKSAEETKFWAQEQLDNEVPEVRIGSQVYTKQDLRSIVRNADRILTKFIPERKEFIQQRAAFEVQAAQWFSNEPWYNDPSTFAYKAYQNALRDPDVAKRPNAKWIAGVQAQGVFDMERRHKANGQKPAAQAESPKQKAPMSQTASGAGFAPNREPSDARAVKELSQAMEKMRSKKGVSGRDVEAYLQKMEQVRQSR